MRAIKPSRIARSLVTVLVLTLVQIVAAPIFTNSALAYTQGTATNGTAYGGTGGSVNPANQNCTNGAIVAIGTTKSGQNLDTFMFICKTINSDASLSATEATTNVMGTPSQSDRCAAGQIAFGIRVIASNAGSLVGGVGLICGNPMSRGSQDTRAIMPDALSAGTVSTFTCGAGQLLAGFSLRTGALVDQITPKCSTFSGFSYAAVGAPTATVTGNSASVSFATVTGSIADTSLTYTVSAVPNSGSTITATGSTSPITVPGLVLRANYTVTVTASNTHGSSPSTSSALASMALPGSDTDTALSLNGTSQFAEVADTTGSVFDMAGTFTLQAWVKPADACSGSGAVISKNVSYMLYCQSGVWFVMALANGLSGSGITTGISVEQNEWHHLAISKISTSGNILFYYDGVLVQTIATGVTTMTPNNNPFRVGQYTGSYFFNGQIDQVQVYNTQRTQAQITADMNAYGLINDSALVAYYDFNEGSGVSTLYNRKAGATTSTDLTITGSPTWTDVKTQSVVGPYTTLTFDRSYLTSVGGWKAPRTVRSSILTVAGGGGGGSRHAGGGGGGGVSYAPTYLLTAASAYEIQIGVGGIGYGQPGNNAYLSGTTFVTSAGGNTNGNGTSGMNSILRPTNILESITAIGGGGGGLAGGSGGGSNGSSSSPGAAIGYSTAFFTAYGNAGGFGYSGAACGADYCGGGGGGAGSVGGIPETAGLAATDRAGNGGNGLPFSTTSQTATYYGGGGGGGAFNSGLDSVGGLGGGAAGGRNSEGAHATYALGGGGGGGGFNGMTSYRGGNGGSGVIVIRWITATAPAFTPPVIAYLNAGMTETFTTNVAQDSATVTLTRTFRWESSTTGVNGTYSVIKQGTGANSAFFSWVPTDTSTSGSTFAYRVVVTDSDTAGLFIVETSTPVWAVINQTLTMTGRSTISKSIGVSKLETFTVGGGTSTFRYTLSPDSPFFWLDTVTATTPRLRIADTATVGTYLETITVTDSVSASVTIPLTIKISPPPSFSANAEQVDSGTVLFLDAGNSASYPRSGTVWSDLSGRGLSGNLTANLGSKLASSSVNTCTAPNFSTVGNGSLVFESGRKTCAYVADVQTLTSYTVDTWIKRSGPQTVNAAIVVTPYSGPGKQINMSLHWASSNQIVAGIYNGSAWITSAVSATIPDDTWVNVVATFSGSTLTLIINNVATTPTTGISVTWNLTNLDTGLVLGRKWDGETEWLTGSLASLRLYNRNLTTAELTQNYNATSGRFLGTQNKVSISGKYGTTVNETFTVTAGSETLTAAFTSNAITGLRWDTSTVRSLKVQLQESLTVGTYLDTVTVTDIYGSSSNFPMTFTVAKADTLTVIIDTPTALSYTGTIANLTPTVRVTGLVSSDTGTAVSSINYKPGGLTCATGGTCAIGDIGPGGGIVFITSSTVGGNGRFFEAAPANLAGVDDVTTAGKFCIGSTNQDAIDRPGTQSGIGWGETNTAIFEAHCTGGAVKLVGDYAGGGFTNWFIPSSSELTELAKVRNPAGLLRLSTTWSTGRFGYWGSTQSSATVMATLVTVNNAWSVGGTAKSDSANNMVRPVRMFTPCWAIDTCTSLSTTTRPTDAGTYSITPDGLSLTQGNLSNYESIQYRASTVTINRISQTAMQIPTYNLIYPDTMTVEVRGGNGTGASVFSVQSGGTASGCTFDYRKLFTTSAGTCSIQIVKAGDRNYLPETATASIFFIQFVFTQATPTVGSGPNIALNGENDVTVDVDFAPMISSLSTYTATAGVTSITIYGVGFNNGDASFEVKFWRGVNGTGFTVNPAKTEITVTVPAGTRTGKVIVVTSKGLAQSELPLTITP